MKEKIKKVPVVECSEAMDELRQLSEEHTQLCRAFVDVDCAIFQGLGVLRMRRTALELIELVLHHLKHEQEFMEQFGLNISSVHLSSFATLRPQLQALSRQLKLGDYEAALNLRLLCRDWLSEHLHVEEIDCEAALAPPRSLSSRSHARAL